MIDAARARSALAGLEASMNPLLVPIAAAIPPGSIWNQTRSFQERLPKVARLRTAYLARAGGRAWRQAEALGIIDMLGSESFRAFGELLVDAPLDPRLGRQIVCYGAGDYLGPHHDHHPDIPLAAGGYLDIHLGFSTAAVRRQLLVYARDGHFTDVVDVAAASLITAYRLPFWHQVTPLEAKRGAAAAARRWLLLGSFHFAAATPVIGAR